jgi:hypothetical protein
MLVAYLSESERSPILQEILDILPKLEDFYYFQEILEYLLPNLNETEKLELLRSISSSQAAKDTLNRSRALMTVFPHLSESNRLLVLPEALRAAQGESEWVRHETLTQLIPDLQRLPLTKLYYIHCGVRHFTGWQRDLAANC